METTMTDQDPQTHDDNGDNSGSQGNAGNRPAVMNWIIIIIGLLVIAQAIALGVFWLHL